jgi:hypothetical protein
MNWEDFGKKRLRPNRGIALEFASRDTGKRHQQPHVRGSVVAVVAVAVNMVTST